MIAGPSFPGGQPGLPEHHFKKRYFNEEYQRQQKETERHLDQQRRQEHYERSQGPVRPGYHPGEPRPGPGYHLAPRQLHPDQYRHPGTDRQTDTHRLTFSTKSGFNLTTALFRGTSRSWISCKLPQQTDDDELQTDDVQQTAPPSPTPSKLRRNKKKMQTM